MSNDWLYKEITARIIAELEKGVVPWKKTWTSADLPVSISSGKNYRGTNIFLLMLSKAARGFKSNAWGTLKTIHRLGGRVKDEEFRKSTLVIFWNVKHHKEETGETDANGDPVYKEWTSMFSWGHHVYNVEQTDLPLEKYLPTARADAHPIEEAEKILMSYANAPPVVKADACWYRPPTDEIGMPEIEEFISDAAYYAARFHETVHSTGHKKRLNRPGVANHDFFGSMTYSQEELVAELGACFLCAKTGIVQDEIMANGASYIDNWIKQLRNDKKLIVMASQDAQKAVDYILGVKHEEKIDA